jgi:hypothetical protein
MDPETVAYWALDLIRRRIVRRIVGRNTVELCPGSVAGTHGRSIATVAQHVAGLNSRRVAVTSWS